MSQEESITKVPPEPQTPQPQKEKDPKKVAAGKKLAEYNKKAKTALERENKRENEAETIGSLMQYVIVCLIGVGLIAINNLFSRYWGKSKLEPSYEPPPPPNTPSVRQPTKVGML